MAQEQFAGPEYFTDFDPKAFAEKSKKKQRYASRTKPMHWMRQTLQSNNNF
ncbi:hypothetical protein ACQX2P_02965 [Corynebacterium diphtheriae]